MASMFSASLKCLGPGHRHWDKLLASHNTHQETSSLIEFPLPSPQACSRSPGGAS